MDIAALGYVVIETTDLEKWRLFGTQILGLMVAPNVHAPQQLYFKMDQYLYRLRIVQGSHDCFLYAGWELPSRASFTRAVQELQSADIAVEIGSREQGGVRGVREFARFVDPVGRIGEIFYGLPLDYAPLLSAVGAHRFITGRNGDMGLGHIAIATPDISASHKFYTDVMGFGQTDHMSIQVPGAERSENHELHFLHVNNPRHHSLALYEDDKTASGDLVHLMLEVDDLDSLGALLDRVHANQLRIVTNLGRHTNDSMVSVYVESPAGFAIEYGFGGEQINWAKYLPTESTRTSVWGHRWGQG
jgi:3,4-dihydroxy-9,10-secoandrosta-1,3,5(10)-triene-9,17-dione 4,5-dioxygenase